MAGSLIPEDGVFIGRILKVSLVGLTVILLAGLGYWAWHHAFSHGLQVDGTVPETGVDALLNRSSVDRLVDGPGAESNTILLVTLDTLRADHLSAYGYPKPTSPFLDQLAEKSVTFERAFASSATTAPSHATLLTSLYPLQHRVLQNGHKMSRDILTLQEILGRAGYRTAAFVATDQHFGPTNVAQGFDHYDAPTEQRELVTEDAVRGIRKLYYRPAQKTLSKALDWIREHKNSEKTFIWVHFLDPHFPYAVRMDFARKVIYSDRDRINRWIDFVRREHHFDLLEGEPTGDLSGNLKVKAHRLYDAEIRYTDRAVRRLVDGVRNHLDTDPMIVAVGDHGEGMGNHDWWPHGRMIYNEQARVPLIVRFPSERYAGRRIDNVVEIGDVMPTLLKQAGVSSEHFTGRRYPIEGTPLQELLNGDTKPFRYAFVQRRYYPPPGWIPYLEWKYHELFFNPVNHPNMRYVFKYEPGEKYALVDESFKYIYSTAYRDQIYDMKDDFYEQENLIADGPKPARLMGLKLRGLVNRLKNESPNAIRSVDYETRNRLRALGYIR